MYRSQRCKCTACSMQYHVLFDEKLYPLGYIGYCCSERAREHLFCVVFFVKINA